MFPAFPTLRFGRVTSWHIAAVLAIVLASSVDGYAQTVRNYVVQFTNTAPLIDGVVSAGEWDAAAAAAGMWGVIREPEGELDTENNRFRMMWDNANLYVLYETDFNEWQDNDPSVERPNISFSPDVLNFYIDPNTDDEENAVPDAELDGYQFAFNMFHHPEDGTLISTDAHRQGVGIYTEAHNNSPFGDQANWNQGGDSVQGPAMQNIVVAQKNGTTGGLAEVVIPWASFNAAEFLPATLEPADFNRNGLIDGNDFLIWQQGLGSFSEVDNTHGDADLDFDVDGDDLTLWKDAYGSNTLVETGLYHPDSPTNGDEWYFQMARQNGLGDNGNFLPAWNWQPAQGFTNRPHGVLTFQGAPVAGTGTVPEPAALSLIAVAAVGLLSMRRRSLGSVRK